MARSLFDRVNLLANIFKQNDIALDNLFSEHAYLSQASTRI